MRPIIVVVVAAALLTACSAAPQASTSPDPSAGPSTAAVPSAIPSPVATPSPLPPPSASPSPTSVAVGPAPAGAWSAVRWIPGGALPLTDHEVSIFGWSGGFVALEQSPGSDEDGNDLAVTIRASESADGLHWSAPTTLETGFKGSIAISSIVEGPSGLLALAYPYGDTCGGPVSVAALWASPDGRAWHRIQMPQDFTSGAVRTIAGGPAGFIGLGVHSDNRTQAIWTSANGRAWTARPLPKVASGTLALDEVASIDGGFVLVGSVLSPGECGGPVHVHFATWFSKDGAAWTRTDLPGAVKDAAATLHVRRLLGRVLVFQVVSDQTNPRAWMSSDGRAWTSVGEVSNDIVWDSASDGVHTIQALAPEEGVGPARLSALDDNAVRRELRQDGDSPTTSVDGPGWIYSVGPTGVLAILSDGSASRLGLPS